MTAKELCFMTFAVAGSLSLIINLFEIIDYCASSDRANDICFPYSSVIGKTFPYNSRWNAICYTNDGGTEVKAKELK